MSAWILDLEHIDLMLTEARKQNAIPEGFTADSWGQLLVDANYLSVNTRYETHDEVPEYVFHPFPLAYDRHDIDVAFRCYRYQSCEDASWDGSEASAWVEQFIVANRERFEPFDVQAAHDDNSRAWGVYVGDEWAESLHVPDARAETSV